MQNVEWKNGDEEEHEGGSIPCTGRDVVTNCILPRFFEKQVVTKVVTRS